MCRVRLLRRYGAGVIRERVAIIALTRFGRSSTLEAIAGADPVTLPGNIRKLLKLEHAPVLDIELSL